MVYTIVAILLLSIAFVVLRAVGAILWSLSEIAVHNAGRVTVTTLRILEIAALTVALTVLRRRKK